MKPTRTNNTTTPAASRRERKAEAQRNRIYTVSLTLFAKHGFDSVSVEAITEKADVAKGTFFNYFPSKSDVIATFWAEVVRDVLEHGESIRSESGRECFHRFFRYLARRVRNEAEIFDLLVRRVGQEPLLHAIDEQVATRETALYRHYFDIGCGAGEFAEAHDALLVAEIVSDLWIGSLRKWVFAGRNFSLARRLDKKLEVLWLALAP